MSQPGSGGPRRPGDRANWSRGQAPGRHGVPRPRHYPEDQPPDSQYSGDQYPGDRYPQGQHPGEEQRYSEGYRPWELQRPPEWQAPREPRGPYYPDGQFYDQQQQPDFRNPRTGSDYRNGDEYGVPPGASHPGGSGVRYTGPTTAQGFRSGPGQPGRSGPPFPPGPPALPRPPLPPGPPLPPRPPGSRKRTRTRGREHESEPGPIRSFFGQPAGRGVLVVLLAFCCWLAFSVGQALTAPGGGDLSSRLAEWARDHYLGPVVTFGEWLTYEPPKVGGQPEFSLTEPQGRLKLDHERGFTPYIPKRLASPAGNPLPGEGEWRLVESVHGAPAIFTTFLRVDAVHTSYVAGIASMDPRLVAFHLHPGAEDPGEGFGGAQSWIPPGERTGLVATFNGGFKLNSAGGGFYLNGATHGTLTPGTASVVYYRNGTVTVGNWGRDVRMTADVVGVRQNLKLIVDHGEVPATVDQDVEGSWGATLGGAYDVWRSGIGVTSDGRVIFIYGPALSVHSLADLLKRAGAVEGMQLDINPYWMSYEYYDAGSHPDEPTPVNLLPTQQQTAYRYFSVYSRDFTTVYAR